MKKKSLWHIATMHDTTEGQGTVKYVFCDPLTARVNDGVLQGGSNF